MRTAARVLYNTARFELIAGLGITVALVVACIALVGQLTQSTPSGSCLALIDSGYGPDDLARCPTLLDFDRIHGLTGFAVYALAVTPTAIAVMIGGSIVAREIEHRTAAFVWSADAGRLRWLAERVAVAMAYVFLIAVICALVGSQVAAAADPGAAPGSSFAFYGLHGPVVVIRTVFAFLLGLVVGAVAGRMIPTLLVAAAGTVLVIAVLSSVATNLGPRQVVADAPGAPKGAMYLGTGFLDENGGFLSTEDAIKRAPPGLDAGSRSTWLFAHFRTAALVIPGSAVGDVSLIEMSMLLVLAGLELGIAAIVVRNRRPY
jgi:hypothetical protein